MMIDDENPAVVDCSPAAGAAPIKNGINDIEISFLIQNKVFIAYHVTAFVVK